MFKSKHSGWTWELKRTPFGDGGGGFFSGIADSIRGATDTGLADWSAENGWMLPLAMITAGVASGALGAGALTAEGGAAAGSAELAGPSLAGNQAFDAAIASGATPTEAAAAGDAAAQAAIDAGQGIGTAAGGTSTGITGTPGADQILNQPNVNVNLGATNGGTVGSLNPALPSAGAPSGTSVGMSGQLAPGTVLGNGLEGGGVIGTSYAAGANGMPATDFFGNYIPASSINTGGVPNTITGTPSSISLSDVNNAKNLAKALTSTAGNQLTGAAQNLATGQTGVGSAIPALIRGNQNPFLQTAQQPIRDAQPMDLSSLANLLKQG